MRILSESCSQRLGRVSAPRERWRWFISPRQLAARISEGSIARESLRANPQPPCTAQNSKSENEPCVRARAEATFLPEVLPSARQNGKRPFPVLLVHPFPTPKLISPSYQSQRADALGGGWTGHAQGGVAHWERRSGSAGRRQAGETASRQAAPEGAPSPAKS